MTFDDWMKANDPHYDKVSDSVFIRRLRWAWDAGAKAERERCAKLCESIAAISDCTLVSKARKEAATNAATGCAKLIRTTEGRK